MATFGPKLSRRDRVRLKLDPVFVAIADGLHVAAGEIGAEASSRVNDSDYMGNPWADWHKRPGTAAWALGKKVAGEANKPRAMRTTKRGADALVGFGFPGGIHERGTVYQTGHPFLASATLDYVTSSRFPQTLADNFPSGNTR